MKQHKIIYSIKNSLKFGCVLCIIFSLISCDKSTKKLEQLNQEELNREQHAEESQVKSNQNIYAEGGQRLSDAATQITDTTQSDIDHVSGKRVDVYMQQFVGRYQTEIECNDPIMHCKTGVAEFVLNLLADGTAHRIIIHLGAIKAGGTKDYYDDHWSYDAQNNQIVVHRANGVFYFYHINTNGSLSFNLERTANYNDGNRAFFEQGNPLPLKAYVLKKMN